MHAQKLPAAAGWRWWRNGFAIFLRKPLLFWLLVICYWVTVIFLNLVPIIGAVAASMVIPGLTVGLMQAARDLEQGKPVGLQTLFGGIKQNPRVLLALGALYLCCTLAILSLSALLDGGDLLRLILSTKPADREALESGSFFLPSVFVMTLMTPVLMAWWFAPVLAAWHGQSVGKSLFFSFIACWINWRAFMVFGAGMILVAGIFLGVGIPSLLASLVSPGQMTLANMFVLILLIVVPILSFFSTVYASFYASYRDIFGKPDIV